MMAKGPQLRMEIVPSESQNESSIIKIRVSKGAKKDVFKDDIYVNNTDAQRLKRIHEREFRLKKKLTPCRSWKIHQFVQS